MTLWVGRNKQDVTIHGNVNLNVDVQKGMVTQFSVSEQAGHLRHFWEQLGRMLDEAEAEQKAAM